MDDSQPPADLLREARERASALLAKLREQQSQLAANSPEIPDDQRRDGEQALHRAIDAAERMIAALESAAECADG